MRAPTTLLALLLSLHAGCTAGMVAPEDDTGDDENAFAGLGVAPSAAAGGT